MTNERYEQIGKRIAEIFGIRKKRDGYYLTHWGKKGDKGLTLMVERIGLLIQAEKKDGCERMI